jgi:hypothetical protein
VFIAHVPDEPDSAIKYPTDRDITIAWFKNIIQDDMFVVIIFVFTYLNKELVDKHNRLKMVTTAQHSMGLRRHKWAYPLSTEKLSRIVPGVLSITSSIPKEERAAPFSEFDIEMCSVKPHVRGSLSTNQHYFLTLAFAAL